MNGDAMTQALEPAAELRPILGYEGLYSITAGGRIWSHKRKGQWLALAEGSAGYLLASLCKDGQQSKCLVHRLVAIAWLPNANPSFDTIINHIDGDKKNNAAVNLEWCTQAHNNRHAYLLGRQKKTPARAAHAALMGRANRSLNADDVASIRRRVAMGERQASLAREYGMSTGNMSRIITRRLYQEIA